MIYLKNVIDFDKVVSELKDQLQTMSEAQIKKAFTDWFWGTTDSESWFYTKNQATEHLEFMKERFLEEYYIFPHKVASELGLEVVES